MPTITTLTPYLLAYEFSARLRDALTADQMAAVVRRNAANHDTACASHDFCDANEFMIEALNGIGQPFDVENEAQANLTNSAWDIAKRCDFVGTRVLEECTLEPDDDGTFAFVSQGVSIIIPTIDEGGQFTNVDPSHYGFYVTETGGGCTAWRREFRLSDGREAYMLVTQDGESSHEIDPTDQWIGMGVYLDDDIGDTWINWRQNVEDANVRDDITAGGEWARPSGTHVQTAAAPASMLHPTDADREAVQAEIRADLVAESLDQASVGADHCATDLIEANRAAGPVESLLILPLIARARALQQEIAVLRDAVDNARRMQP